MKRIQKTLEVRTIADLEKHFGAENVTKVALDLAYDKPVKTKEGATVTAGAGFAEYLYDQFLPTVDHGGSAIEFDNQ